MSSPQPKADLIKGWLYDSVRADAHRRIGIEVENFSVWDDGAPFTYFPNPRKQGPIRGAGELFEVLSKRYQWDIQRNEKGEPLGLKTPFGKVSLEPGSQLELATEPLSNLNAIVRATTEFEKALHTVTDPVALDWLPIGVNPFHSVKDIDVIPSARYHIMTDYLGRSGALGTSMMRLTTSVQINLDYTSEAEAIEMLRVGLLLAPLSYALFGNSPFSEGKRSQYLSYRGKIWQDTDAARCGLLPIAFSKDFGFETYAEFLWRLPLMFAQDAKGNYVSAQGKNLTQIERGELPGVTADARNQRNAIQELFTEMRLKPGYLEVRSVDGQTSQLRNAAAAFWVGILYSAENRADTLQRMHGVTPQKLEQLLDIACRKGLQGSLDSISLLALARDLVPKAEQGLRARGLGEEVYLTPLKTMIHTGINRAACLLKWYEGQSNSIPVRLRPETWPEAELTCST